MLFDQEGAIGAKKSAPPVRVLFGELPDALNWAKPFAITFEAS